MGTTLTGLTPATTYDALIKVTDNGPLSATAKYLSDGLGNDSILALSSNKVGIGTFAPSQPLHVNGNMRLNGALYDNNNLAGTSGQILSSTGTATNWIDVSSLGVVDGSGTANYVSKWSDPNTLTNSVIYDNGTKVGIGTTSPNSKLDIVQTSNAEAFRVEGAAGGFAFLVDGGTSYKTIIRNASIGNSYFGTAAPSNGLIVEGNVGIGTSSPTAKFVALNGVGNTEVAIFSGTDEDRGLSISAFEVDGYGQAGVNLNAQYSLASALSISTSGVERMRITSAGNVGIGTSSPTARLDVNSGTTNITSAFRSTDAGAYVGFADDTTTLDSGFPTLLCGAVGNDFLVITNNSEKMRVTSAGNVGIGTSSPATALHIANASNAVVRAEGTATNGEATVQLLGKNSSGTARSAIFKYDNSDLIRIGVSQAVDMRFETNDTERLRILSDGGLTFNGDTAQANALDDYEEGTWTPTSNTSGYTISASSGTYTKIGRQVTIQGSVQFSAIDVLSTSLFIFLGLPFDPSQSFQGVCRENTSTGAIFVAQVADSPSRGILNSMDGVTTASQEAFAINRTYRFTITYFV